MSTGGRDVSGERTKEALDRIGAALRGLRYGTVTAVVQDGVVVGRCFSGSGAASISAVPETARHPPPARLDPAGHAADSRRVGPVRLVVYSDYL
jgi:hypothetical protein